jgi:hypothetical protein
VIDQAALRKLLSCAQNVRAIRRNVGIRGHRSCLSLSEPLDPQLDPRGLAQVEFLSGPVECQPFRLGFLEGLSSAAHDGAELYGDGLGEGH